jgi:predicted transcriptional regulator
MSDTTTIRVKKELYDAMKSLAKQKGQNMQDILKQAIRDYRKREFFDSLNASYARLKAVPGAWAEEEKERVEWDATLSDGLEN